MVHENSLKNLEKGQGYFKRTTKEEQKKIASEGGKASGESRNWKSILNTHVGEHWNTPIEDARWKAKLKNAGLPQTFFGKMLYEAIGNAGKNPAMLRTMLEAMDVLRGQQTTVTVNNNPYADLSDETLKKMAEEE